VIDHSRARTGRRDQITAAAVDVLGNAGPRGLTHRAVDLAAGAPIGSASNYFRTRTALVEAIVEHLEQLDRADLQRLTALPRPAGTPRAEDAGLLAAVLAGNLRHAAGPGRTRTLARYALCLEASTRPELREPLRRAHDRRAAWAASWLRDLGSPTPELHATLLLDHLEGALLRRVTFPPSASDPASAPDRDTERELRALFSGWLLRPR
jgi:DNA-binding transcriptional regulator YbjK